MGDILQQMTKATETPIDPPIAREIAMRAGAVRVIFASVTGAVGNYKLNVEVQEPDAGSPSRYRDHWIGTFTWRSSSPSNSSNPIPPELLAAIRNASDWIRQEIGESANDIATLDVPPGDVTTGNWQALAEYARAERLITLRRQEDAVLALQDATQVDPHFALAFARMGDILLSLSRSVEGYRAPYSMALAASDQSRLTRHERDRIRGIYAFDTGDYQKRRALFS